MELSKEERDRRANLKMEEMKRKNEEYIKRFKEIEADKANADRMSSSVVVEPAKPYVMRARTPRAQPQPTSQDGAPPPLMASPVLAVPPPPPERGGPPPDPVYRFLSDPDRDGDDCAPPPQQQQQLTPPRSGNRSGDKQDRWRGGGGGGGRGRGGDAGRGGNWTPRGGGRGKEGRRGGRGRGNRGDRSFGGVDSSYDQRDESSSWQFNQSAGGAAVDVGPSTPGSSGMWHNSGFNESLANMSAGYGCPEASTPETSNRMGLLPTAGLSSTPNIMATQSNITNEGLLTESFKLSGDLASRLNSRDIRLEPQSPDDQNNQFQAGRDGGRGGFTRSHVDWRQPQEDGINSNCSATVDPNGNAGAPPFADSSDLRHSLSRNGHDSSWNRGGDGTSMDGGPPRQGWGSEHGGGGGHNRSWHEGRGGGRGGGGRDGRGGRQDGRRGERGGGRKPGRGRGYDKWKAERDAIDEQRIQRARAGDGGWRRAWDNEKINQGEREDTEPVYDPRFPPSKSEGIQLGDFLAASPSLEPSLQQQQAPESAPPTYTQERTKSPEYIPSDHPSAPITPSSDDRRGGAKSGHSNRNEIRGGRRERHTNQVRPANTTANMSAAAGTVSVAGYSGSWCMDASQEPVRDGGYEPISSEVLVDPKAQCVAGDTDNNEGKRSDGGSMNEITQMVEQMVTQERQKQDLKKYTQQPSTVSDIGAAGFGFGEDCLTAEWYDSSSRKERQASEGRREGGKSKRNLWVAEDAAPHSPGSSKEGSPRAGPSQEPAAAPVLSFEELLQQHRSVQQEMYGPADEDDHHRQGHRSSGKASRKDGRVTKRAVRRNKLGAAETILEDPSAGDGTVTDMNKVSAALEALIFETGSEPTGTRPSQDGSWNEGQPEDGATAAEAAEMRNVKKNPALETLEEDFLNKLRDVDARADSVCGVALNGTLNNGVSGVIDCEQPTPTVQSDFSAPSKVVSSTEEIPPAALVPLPEDDDISEADGSQDVDEFKDIGSVTISFDEGTSSPMAGPDDSKNLQQTVGNQETQSLASPHATPVACESFTPSGKVVDGEAENKTTVDSLHTQQNGGATTTPAPVASLSAFNSPSTTSFSTTPAQSGGAVSSEALEVNDGGDNIGTPPVSIMPSAASDTAADGDVVVEEDEASNQPGPAPEATVTEELDGGGCDGKGSVEMDNELMELGTEGDSGVNVVDVLPPCDPGRLVGADNLVQTNSDLDFNESNRVGEQICGAVVEGASLNVVGVVGSSPAVSDIAESCATAPPGDCDTTASACVGEASGSCEEDGVLSQEGATDHPGLGHISSVCHDSADTEDSCHVSANLEQLKETREHECLADSSMIVEENLNNSETSLEEKQLDGVSQSNDLARAASDSNNSSDKTFSKVDQVEGSSASFTTKSSNDEPSLCVSSLDQAAVVVETETVLPSVASSSDLGHISDTFNAGIEISAADHDDQTVAAAAVEGTVLKLADDALVVEINSCGAKEASDSVVVETSANSVGSTTVTDSERTADIVDTETAVDPTVLQTANYNSSVNTISDDTCEEAAVNTACMVTTAVNSSMQKATASVIKDTVADSSSIIAVDELKTDSNVALNLAVDVDIQNEADCIDVGKLDTDVGPVVSDSGPVLESVEARVADLEAPLTAVQDAASVGGKNITSIDNESTQVADPITIKDDNSGVVLESIGESTPACVEAAPHTTSAGDLESAVESTAASVVAAADATSAGDLESAVESTAASVVAAADPASAGDVGSPIESDANRGQTESDLASSPTEETTSTDEPASAIVLDSKPAVASPSAAASSSAKVSSSAPKTPLRSKSTMSQSGRLLPRAAAPVPAKPMRSSSSASLTGSTTSRTVSATPLSARSGSLSKQGAAAGPAAVGTRTSLAAGRVSSKPSSVVGKTLPAVGRVSSSGVSTSLSSSTAGSSIKSTLSSRPSAASKQTVVASETAPPSRPTSSLRTTKSVASSESTTKSSISSSSSTTKVATSSLSTSKLTVKATPSIKLSATSTIKSSAGLAAKPSTVTRTPAPGLSKAKSTAPAGATASAPLKAGLSSQGAAKAPRPSAVKTAPKATVSSAKERPPATKAATTEKKSPAGT